MCRPQPVVAVPQCLPRRHREKLLSKEAQRENASLLRGYGRWWRRLLCELPPLAGDGAVELLEDLGMSVAEYAAAGFILAVVHIEMDYLAPAMLGDELEIDMEVERVRRVRFTVRQRVKRIADGQELVAATVTLACLSREGRVISLPDELAGALRSRVRLTTLPTRGSWISRMTTRDGCGRRSLLDQPETGPATRLPGRRPILARAVAWLPAARLPRC